MRCLYLLPWHGTSHSSRSKAPPGAPQRAVEDSRQKAISPSIGLGAQALGSLWVALSGHPAFFILHSAFALLLVWGGLGVA